MSSSIKVGGRRGRSDKGVMLKCLAAASRRNLSCQQGEQHPADGATAATPCCELLMNKFGTTEPDVIKEIFKKRIQDRVMRRGQQQQQEEQQHPQQQQRQPQQVEEAHDPEPTPVHEPDNERRQGGDLFGKKVNDGGGGGGGIAHQLQRPQNRDGVRQRLRPSHSTATRRRQQLRPIGTTTGPSYPNKNY